MIAEALRIRIEQHAGQVRTRNPLLRLARCGGLPPRAVGTHLASMRFLIGHTPVHLAAAQRGSAARGLCALAEYFGVKLVEEHGHDQWAESDLDTLCAAFELDRGSLQPVPSIVRLAGYLAEVIETDPNLYLAYVLWVEYFTVLTAGEFVEAVVENCRVPAGAMSCLARHVELDKAHAAEGLEAIDRIVTDSSYAAPMQTVMQTAMDLFDRACEEIAAVAKSHREDTDASRRVTL